MLKRLNEVSVEDIQSLQEHGNYIDVMTSRGALRTVQMKFKWEEINGEWRRIPDCPVMWTGRRWEPLSNELAKVFDPKAYDKRMKRKAKKQAEQKAKRDEMKAQREARQSLSFEERFGGETSEGYMGATKWVGSNNHGYLSDTELASAIREDLKEYMGLPKNCIKVRKESYSMGRHIYITLKLDYSHARENIGELSSEQTLSINAYHIDKYSKYLNSEAVDLLKRARRIIDSYNYDDSNSMVDYFDKDFYYDLDIEWLNKPEEKAA